MKTGELLTSRIAVEFYKYNFYCEQLKSNSIHLLRVGVEAEEAQRSQKPVKIEYLESVIFWHRIHLSS